MTDERHDWRHATEDEAAVTCIQCTRPVDADRHRPSGAIAFLNGAPYEWHPAVFTDATAARVVVIPDDMTVDDFMKFVGGWTQR